MLLAAAPEGGAETAHEAAQPLIDIDGTVFVELTLFLVMLAILQVFVFKPFLRARAEREDRIEGERRRAQEMDEAARAKVAQLEEQLEAAKARGVGMRDQARGAAAQREREILDRARAEVARMIEDSRKAAAQAEQAARARLTISAEEWARKLASRILGREVA
jgi:F-type H+-transporting ATPase subunit b